MRRVQNHRPCTVKNKQVLAPPHQYIEGLRARFFGALEIAMDSLLDELRNPNSKTRGWLSFEMLKAGSVIPENDQKVKLELPVQQPDPDTERAGIKRIAIAMLENAIEKHRFYGLPLPEADEVEQSLLGKEKGARNGHE
jgi:hypothetical protein